MRYTQKNHDGETFRIPIERFGEFRIDKCGFSQAMFGDIANRLGRYEAALTIEEAEAYAKGKK